MGEKTMPEEGDEVEVVLRGKVCHADLGWFRVGAAVGHDNCIFPTAEHVQSVKVIQPEYEWDVFYRSPDGGRIVVKTAQGWTVFYEDGSTATFAGDSPVVASWCPLERII